MKDHFFKLTLVTNKNTHALEEYLDFVRLCAKSGITAVQLREKSLGFNDLLAFGQQLQSVLKPYSIPLIVNDNIALAYELDAVGVHLGQSDGDVLDARKRLGENKIIGLTINTLAQLQIANKLSIDYVVIGAIFPTNNKLNVATVWGCEGLEKIAQVSKHPIIAIGGIDETNAALVMRSGAGGIAAIRAFHDAPNPILVTQYLRDIIEGGFHA